MIIKIICDQTDCIHCHGDFTGPDYSWENRCKNPDGVVISTKKGCQSKEQSIKDDKDFFVPEFGGIG
jgi:hypothetical protein